MQNRSGRATDDDMINQTGVETAGAGEAGHMTFADLLAPMTPDRGSVMNSVYLGWPMRVSDTVTH